MDFKKTTLHLFIGAMLLCLLSCAKEDEFELPTLVLSENTVAFDRGVGERNISITTNQSNWVASSPQEGEWLSLVQDGNVLKVKVAENKMGAERTSYVLVNANGTTAKVEVRQSAADVTLEVVPTAIYLPQMGGEKIVDVTTNSSVYEVTPSEEVSWLKIFKHDEEIKLVAERNDTYLNREVKLYAKSGAETREITVTQSGIQRFILPINPGMPQDAHKIMEYEVGRGSYYLYRRRNYGCGSRKGQGVREIPYRQWLCTQQFGIEQGVRERESTAFAEGLHIRKARKSRREPDI